MASSRRDPDQGQGPHPGNGRRRALQPQLRPSQACLGGVGLEASLGTSSVLLVERPLCAGEAGSPAGDPSDPQVPLGGCGP